MLKHWWKILSLALLIFSVIFGLTTRIPYDRMLEHSIRNVFYHAPMWFGMLVMYSISFFYAIKFLSKQKQSHDAASSSFAKMGALFNILGILTGMVWARIAWGSYWNSDPKLIGAAICLLMYLAYFVLRQSVKDEEKRSRIAAVYNVFAYFLMFPSIYIVPGMLASSHPGGAGDSAFMVFKMDPALRLIFYPACIGWILLGIWIARIRSRVENLKNFT
jgi:heme exporter protein C